MNNGAYVTFFGNLTRDPEKKFTQDEATPYARITVAVNTYFAGGRQETTFYDVVLFDRNADAAVNRCEKGTPVFVGGRLSHNVFTKRDGTKDFGLHVQARDFRVLHRAPADARRPAGLEEGQEPAPEDGDHIEDIEEIDFNAPFTPADYEEGQQEPAEATA